MKSINSPEAKTRIVNEFEQGRLIRIIADGLNRDGYTLLNGNEIPTSYISKIAIAAGCAKRTYRKTKKQKRAEKLAARRATNPVSPKPVTTDFSKVVVEIMSSDLSEAAKKDFLRWKLSDVSK